jgi:2-oxoisovalerate dehydrogenase E1 component beta subunit
VVHEAQITGGYGGEIAARIMEDDFTSLEAPVLRVGGFDMPYPPAKSEDLFLPDVDRILDAVDKVLNY